MANEFQLDGIVPWGRSAMEYESFFALSDVGVGCRVLDCGGGPASFAAEWGARGHFVVSADPLYQKSPEEIVGEFDPVSIRMLEGMHSARDRFQWGYYGSPEAVVERRRNALRGFAADRTALIRKACYVAARLPALPFKSDAFDLVLCSHLLFLYSDELDLDAHIAGLGEMLRVGFEVRVFPLIDLHGSPSRHITPAADYFMKAAHCEVVPVPFEFQSGASSMLRLRRRSAQ